MTRIPLASMVLSALAVLALQPESLAAQQGFRPPSDLPPSGFEGTQFVDGLGCIYIRAGVAGVATWVPRVTRDRRQICGFVPSFPNRTTSGAVTAATPPGTRVETSASRSAPDATAAAAVKVSPNTRVLPDHLYARRKLEGPVKTPRGYRAAWQDGRLNPKRAEQTMDGQSQMRRIWTDTVPRRLVD